MVLVALAAAFGTASSSEWPGGETGARGKGGTGREAGSSGPDPHERATSREGAREVVG